MTYPVDRVVRISATDLPEGWSREIRYSTEPYFAKLVVRNQDGKERSSQPLGYYDGGFFGSRELADLCALAWQAVTATIRKDRHAQK